MRFHPEEAAANKKGPTKRGAAKDEEPPQKAYAKVKRDDDDYGSEDDSGNDDNTPYTKFYQIAHYGHYFNVSTMDVLHRLRKSIWPFCSKSMMFSDGNDIDLYGPIWIMITLIVEIAVVGFINYQIDIATMVMEAKSGYS